MTWIIPQTMYRHAHLPASKLNGRFGVSDNFGNGADSGIHPFLRNIFCQLYRSVSFKL